MTLGITPVNYSLETLWCGGLLSCLSQVKKLYISPTLQIIRLQINVCLLSLRSWITDIYWKSNRELVFWQKKGISASVHWKPQCKHIYSYLMHFKTKLFPQKTFVVVACAFVQGVWWLYCHSLCVWHSELANELWLQVVVKKLSFFKADPCTFCQSVTVNSITVSVTSWLL